MLAVNQVKPAQPIIKKTGLSLTPYLNTPLRLFVWDDLLLKQMLTALNVLGFHSVSNTWVKPNYFQAMRQLFSQLVSFDGLVLVNQPPQIKPVASETTSDPGISDFFGGVASLIGGGQDKIQRLLCKCIPVVIAPHDQQIRENIIKELLPLGITGCFMLSEPSGALSPDLMLGLRSKELHYHLLEHFIHGEQRVDSYRQGKQAAEMRVRRARAEVLLTEVEKLKANKQFDHAVALCKKAIELLPEEPDAYLEGGRIMVKKRKYTAALRMFRDAEEVARDLPTPNQEIGLCRVAQVKDYLEQCGFNGTPVQKSRIEQYLQEAVDAFRESMDKADAIKSLNPDEQETRRQEVLAQIATSMLSLGLNEVLPESHPQLLELVGLAQECLTTRISGETELTALQLIPLALKAFYEGDLDRAENDLLLAAQDPEAFNKACIKLNYIGTQLRRMGDHDRALRIYDKLLEIKPPFRGVILFNQAIAQQSKISHHKPQTLLEQNKQEAVSFGLAVEALFEEPTLPYDDNFYKNKVLAPIFIKGVKLFQAACMSGNKVEEPYAEPCRQARDNLDDLISRGKTSQAVQYMLRTASKLPQFFVHFDQHPSTQITNLAKKLEPLLMQRPEPKLQSLGKLLALLIKRGMSPKQEIGSAVDPLLEPAAKALLRSEPGQGAGLLAAALWSKPQLIDNNDFMQIKGFMNLCRQVEQKLNTVNLGKFNCSSDNATIPMDSDDTQSISSNYKSVIRERRG